jgi:hypothetical protein
MYIFVNIFFKANLSYDFHIFQLNNLKVIYDSYFQYLIKILSKTTFFTCGGSIIY